MKMKVKIIKGKYLSQKNIAQLNKIMQEAFSDKDTLEIGNRQNYSKDIFFVLYNKEKILSLGRLRPAKINILGKSYKILGIADIISIIKGKGYGKKIVQSMHKYLEKTNNRGLGFCRRDNSLFYKKSGLNVERNISKKFIYRDNHGKNIKDRISQDVIYSNNAKQLIKLILSNLNLEINISREHW